jgi:hypothetical protein
MDASFEIILLDQGVRDTPKHETITVKLMYTFFCHFVAAKAAA